MIDIATLQETLGVRFKDPALLEQALVHSSYVNENPTSGLESNERLEFLGDAVLGLVIAEKLHQDFPDLPEGEMTCLRAALVRKDTLARVARALKLGDCLSLGKGEELSSGRNKAANLARALESVIAAVFLDSGLPVTRKMVLALFKEELARVTCDGRVIDYKSQLQEIIQSKYHASPHYRVLEAEGPDHARLFTIEAIGGGEVLGVGTGKSKKLAEQEAARDALQKHFTP